MIKFKNINGDVFLAVGSVKRKSALNGEKSLSATITQGDDVLNKIDKGWSLEFDNEPYVVTYFERNDNNNTVEIDAIHKFFWDMTKSVLYNSYSNSHVARFYLDEIFKDTGYTYALNFDPKAFEKENWGMKNKLSLFNDIISSIGAEFEINGTLISIFKNVGSDLSTIVRHGFNLSDMTLENDNANFATYGEGFGAYDDKENQKGPRLHVTYTSPLAKAFGKLHAEPIVDERYTVKDNLLSAVKDKVDSSFAVSVKLSLYDLTAAGYPYKMANVGDWLLAVDEHLDFKQKIRIISVDDEFAEDGTRISYTVTCGDVGVTKKYQDANAALTQKVQSAYENAQTAKDAAIQAVISSTGKNTIYDNIDGEENLPKTANEGDLAFVQTGDGKAMYIYTKMPDGSFEWVKRLDPDTGEQIAAGVEEAIVTANKHTDELNEKQASEAAAFQSEANVALSSAAAERADMFKQSTSMASSAATHADSMASSAAAYGKAQAASALSSANLELAKAKQELGSEVSKAQSDIVATNKELAGKVSQSDFDKKTGDLTTKYGQVKATADSVTTEVSNYKAANDRKVSANTANIKTLDDQITSKVSQTDYDKETKDLEGKYSETKQTVDSISQTVTELQAKANSQGQVNQLMNTEFNPDLEGWEVSSTSSSTKAPYRSYWDKSNQAYTVGFNTVDGAQNSYAQFIQTVQLASTPVGTGYQVSLSWYAWCQQVTNYNNLWVRFYDKSNNQLKEAVKIWADENTNRFVVQNKWEGIEVPEGSTYVKVWFDAREGTLAYLARPMFVLGPTIGDYVAGNYTNNNRVAALELDINGIHGLVNDPKKGLSATWNLASDGQSIAVQAKTAASTADGKAVAAQELATTANTTANGTQTTITNFQKDVKDLKSTITKTAGQVTTEIEDRKNGDKSVRTDMAKLIDQRITDTKTGYESAISQSANAIMASVSTPNQLLNTEFNPDLEGWETYADNGIKKPYRSYFESNIGATVVGFDTTDSTAKLFAHFRQTVQLPSSPGAGKQISLSWYAYCKRVDNYNNLWVRFFDNSGNQLKETVYKWADENTTRFVVKNNWNGIDVPDTAVSMYVSFEAREGTQAYLARPMLTFTSKAPDAYMPGSYSGMNTSTVLQLFKDNWGIGLADNIGKITSGIIGDKNSLNLINNNIVLQGNTTVTADFYAKGGNFKNLNASNFTTGTINAAKINVINLDVSSLSGNITNFIKSYWNNAYSNVTIDANGMSVTSGKKRTDFRNGAINIQTQRGENLGFLGTSHLTQDDTVDYLTLSLNGYRTTKPGDDHYDPSSKDFYGGDGISFDVSGPNGQYGPIMRWNSDYAANVIGTDSGWQVLDRMYVEKGLYAHNAPEHWRVSWTAWSDWGNYKNVSLTNTKGSAGIAVNDDNLILFGTNKRTDGTKGWKV